MLEHQIGCELQSKPIFELDNQIHRICGIETKPGQLRVWVDALVRQLESPCQLFDAPVPDLEFGRISCWQTNSPRADANGVP